MSLRTVTPFLLCLLTVVSSRGDVIITFSDGGPPANGDQLDGHQAGDTGMFTDTMSMVESVLTTREVRDDSGNAGSGASLIVDDGALGVNSGGSDDDFDANETWVFDWDVASEFRGIAFDDVGGNDSFRVQSDSWRNLAITPETGDGVSYDAGLGAFLFSNNSNDEDFTLFDLVGNSGAVLTVDTGDDIEIAYTGTQNAVIASLTFGLGAAAAIPEPAHFALIGLGLGGLIMARRKSKAA